jgi:hypothetical protein
MTKAKADFIGPTPMLNIGVDRQSVPVHPPISLLANGSAPPTNNNHFSGGASPLVNVLLSTFHPTMHSIHQIYRVFAYK